jgi:hypothetical protein
MPFLMLPRCAVSGVARRPAAGRHALDSAHLGSYRPDLAKRPGGDHVAVAESDLWNRPLFLIAVSDL